MAMSLDITLPVGVAPRWPTECIACGRPDPDGEFCFRAARVGWSQFITLSWAIGSRPTVRVPACQSCAAHLRRTRFFRSLGFWIIAIPVLLGVYVLLRKLGWTNGPFRMHIAVGLGMVALVPFITLEIVWPPMIDATARGAKIDYEFADHEYAKRFIAENIEEVAAEMG